MNFQPLSILLTIIGGLILAGLLGWIRRPRLVVFVPRLFSHSRISDKGQIVEISIMNRGFKTEEAVELSLSPSMHYEIIGSNNPDATLSANKLFVPRIGSADDCSALLQVEGGKFTHSEIVSCLSKETKAIIATKLEQVPVTAQQRVGMLMFFGVVALLALLFVKGFDYITNQLPTVADASNSTPVKATDTQGWNIGDIYKRDNNEIYKSLLNQQLIISIGSARVQKSTAVIPIIAENKSNATFTLRAELISSVDQDPLAILKGVLNGAVLFQGDSLTKELQVAIPAEQARRKVIVQIFVESSDGDTLSARRTLNLSGY